VELIRYRIRLGDRQLWNLAPLCAAGIKSPCYMKMQVTYRLISGHTIVLPHGYTWPAIGEIDYMCSMAYFAHNYSGLFIGQVKNRGTVTGRHHQQMRYSPLLTSNQNGGKFVAKEDRIWSLTSKICTKGTLRIYGQLNTATSGHDGRNDFRNA
jgi:hypothetical protein